MRDLVILLVHIIATLARLLGPGGIHYVVAESVPVKQQLPIFNRSRQRSPNLRSSDRLVVGLVCSPHSPCPPDPLSHHTETLDSLELPPNSEESKVSAALLTQAQTQAWSKGTVQRTPRSCCPNKTAQSDQGLSPEPSDP